MTNSDLTFLVLALGLVEVNKFLEVLLVAQHPLALPQVQVVVRETHHGPYQRLVTSLDTCRKNFWSLNFFVGWSKKKMLTIVGSPPSK